MVVIVVVVVRSTIILKRKNGARKVQNKTLWQGETDSGSHPDGFRASFLALVATTRL